MSSPSTVNFTVRAKVRPRDRDGLRLLIVLAVIGIVVAAGLSVTTDFQFSRPQPVAALGPSNYEIYTGSILYMPGEGEWCRQILFDNRSGRLNDNGVVDCERAAYRSETPKHWSAARARVISTGFRQR